MSPARRERRSLACPCGRVPGMFFKGNAVATTQDVSPACEVVAKAPDLLTIQSETRHPRGWTADPRVSAGRSQCPKARKERKSAPSSWPSLGELSGERGVLPQDRDSVRAECVKAQLEPR